MSMGVSTNDRDILTRFKEGDQLAFQEIYDLFFTRIHLFVSKYIDEGADKDTTQEAFVKLWETRANITSLDHAKNFLFLIVKNKCVDYLRFQKYENRKIREIQEIQAFESSIDAQHAIIIQDQLDWLEHSVKKLPLKYQQIYHLAYREWKSNQEIATYLNIAVQTVVNRKVLTLKKLRQAIGERNIPQLLSLIALWRLLLNDF